MTKLARTMLMFLIVWIISCTPPIQYQDSGAVQMLMASSYDRSGGNADGSGYCLSHNDNRCVVVEGSGHIKRIWATDNKDLQGSLWLDGVPTPLTELFAETKCSGQSAGGFYSYCNRSFQERIEFDHVPPYYQIAYSKDAQPNRGLIAIHSVASPTITGKDFVLADVHGHGEIIGVILNIRDFNNEAILEGDERIYVNGRLTMHGTGIEDFFNAGWYFQGGSFMLPTHGAILSSDNNGRNVTAYRFMLTDSIPFNGHLLFTMEHGGQNDLNAHFESVVLIHLDKEQSDD